jgi:hypothetical protein
MVQDGERTPPSEFEKFGKRLTLSVQAGVISKDVAVDILKGVSRLLEENTNKAFDNVRKLQIEFHEREDAKTRILLIKMMIISSFIGTLIGLIIGLTSS